MFPSEDTVLDEVIASCFEEELRDSTSTLAGSGRETGLGALSEEIESGLLIVAIPKGGRA